MTDIVYRTYTRGSTEVDISDVSDMLEQKHIKVEHDIDIDPSSWSDNTGCYTRIRLGLPTEKHHQILERSLKRLGYTPVISTGVIS